MYLVRFHDNNDSRSSPTLDGALDLLDARYPGALIGVWDWKNRPYGEVATIYRGRINPEPMAVAYIHRTEGLWWTQRKEVKP